MSSFRYSRSWQWRGDRAGARWGRTWWRLGRTWWLGWARLLGWTWFLRWLLGRPRLLWRLVAFVELWYQLRRVLPGLRLRLQLPGVLQLSSLQLCLCPGSVYAADVRVSPGADLYSRRRSFCRPDGQAGDRASLCATQTSVCPCPAATGHDSSKSAGDDDRFSDPGACPDRTLARHLGSGSESLQLYARTHGDLHRQPLSALDGLLFAQRPFGGSQLLQLFLADLGVLQAK